MIDLTALKLAVMNQPDLAKMVNQLNRDHHRLAAIVAHLTKLDEVITQRLETFDHLKSTNDPLVTEIVTNCQDLLMIISAFINMAITPVDERIDNAVSVYNDLMKRL